MKVLRTDIELFEGYANDPELVITVDKVPLWDEFVYETAETVSGSTLFYGVHESGLVRFFSENPTNRRGYGGASFDIKLSDGRVRRLVGPWSSRCGVMNAYFEPHSVEVILIEELTGNKFSYAITVELAKQLCEDAGLEITASNVRGEIRYLVNPRPLEIKGYNS